MFDPILVQNNLNYQYGGSTPIYIFIALRGVIMFAWPFLIKSSGFATTTKEKDKLHRESSPFTFGYEKHTCWKQHLLKRERRKREDRRN